MRTFKGAIFAIAFACGAACAAEPTIDTIAGGGTTVGDGIPAKQAVLNEPRDIAVDAAGNVYIAEMCRIRKVSTSGIITTIAGNGSGSGTAPTSGTQATSGPICSNTVAVDGFGYVYYASNARIGKVSVTGVVTLVAGTGTGGYSGDGGLATSAKINIIEDITVDAVGNVFIADSNRIRRIATNGIITTFAGTGAAGDDGDYGPATTATVAATDLAFDRIGNLFLVNNWRHTVRRIDTSGMITTVMGGFPNYRSDPIAIHVNPQTPTGLATDAEGNLYVANLAGYVSMVSRDSAIQHVIGRFNDTPFSDSSGPSFGGDGGPAGLGIVREPDGLATDAHDNLYIVDKGNLRIRKVTGRLATPTLPAGAFAFEHATPMHLVSANQYTVGVAKGDANGDGRTDVFLLTANWDETQPLPGDWALYVYRQTPEGALAAPVATPVPHLLLTDVMSIDLNHDRYTDIVFSAYDYSNKMPCVYVMLGSANGMSAPAPYSGIGGANGAYYLQQADMNRDGHMDVLAYVSTGGSGAGTFAKWAIYYNNGTGTLVSRKLSPVEYAHSALVRDFNGDGLPDMLFGWSTLEDSGVTVAYHDGVDNFLPQTFHPGVGSPNRSGFFPVVADFNGDDVEDLLFSIDGNAPNAKLTHWVLTPGGGFDYVGEWGAYDGAQTLVAEDMNNDGRKDLLIRHTGWSSIGYMQQARKPDGSFWLDREVKSHARVGNQATPHSMTVGHFNNDACLDVAITASNSGLQVQYGTCATTVRRVAHDYDGDGTSDILWRNAVTGLNAVWKAANNATQLVVASVTNLAWKIVAQGDFDNDGKDDIVWRNTANGVNTIWRSANNATQKAMPTVSLTWSVAGVGDFDGDGADDLLWRNNATGANGVWRSGNSATQLPVTGVTNLQWRVVGVGDFDGDGKSDIFWRNATTGTNTIWRSADNATQIAVTGVLNLTWKVQGVGDFDGNGKADVFWRNAQTGINTIWIAAQSSSQRAVTTVNGASWRVVAVGDYDADGSDDLLWHNATDGRNGLWRSGNAATQLGVTDVTNTSWSIVPYANQP